MAFIYSLISLFTNSISRRKATPGFFINILLSVSFIIFRKIPPICTYSVNKEGDTCSLSWKECETFIFLLVVTAFKNRQAISVEQVVLNTLMFTKIVNVVLFYQVDYRLAFIYSLLCIVRIWIYRNDFVEGNEITTYFNGNTLEEELENNPSVTWVILFFTTWSPKCNAVMPVFAGLSEQFSKPFLKFGKLDVGKYPDAGLKYGVKASTTSIQLPTIIVFENGKMTNWRPAIGNKKTLIKYVFSEERIVEDFALHKLKQDAIDKEKKSSKSNKKTD